MLSRSLELYISREKLLHPLAYIKAELSYKPFGSTVRVLRDFTPFLQAIFLLTESRVHVKQPCVKGNFL